MPWLFPFLIAPSPQPVAPPASAVEQLRWEVDAGCPDEDWVRARVDEFRGPNSVEGFEARASIVSSDEGFALDSHIETPAGRSELVVTDADCEALATAFALSIALALEPEVASESLEALAARDTELVPPIEDEPAAPEPAPEPEPEPQPEPEPVRIGETELDDELRFDLGGAGDDRVDRPPRRVLPVSGWLQLSFAGGLGLGPGVDLPLRLAGGARFSLWEASLAAVYLPPSSARSGGAELLRTTGLGGQLRLARVVELASSRWELPLSVYGEGGWMRGRGVEVGGARSVNASWWALGLGGGVRWLAGSRLFLALELDGQVQPGRPAFALTGAEDSPIHESSLLAFRAGLAVGTRFGSAKKRSVARDHPGVAGTLEL